MGSQPKWKTTSTKMEDDLNQNGRRPHPKWKTISPKMGDDLTQNGRRPHPKWRTTSPEMEDDQNGRRAKWKTTLNMLEIVGGGLTNLGTLLSQGSGIFTSVDKSDNLILLHPN